MNLRSSELSEKYDRLAPWYDCIEGIPDLLGIRKLRHRLVQQARGKVLEVAIGTGKNLPYYPRANHIIAVDLSRQMLEIGRRRARKLSMKVSLSMADAAALPFGDAKFDTVVASLSTCTFPEPVAALREMARVCRPTGKVLLLEHGRSDRAWLARFQDRHPDAFMKPLGCQWNRRPLDLVREAGLRINDARQFCFGIFNRIEAEPGSPRFR